MRRHWVIGSFAVSCLILLLAATAQTDRPRVPPAGPAVRSAAASAAVSAVQARTGVSSAGPAAAVSAVAPATAVSPAAPAAAVGPAGPAAAVSPAGAVAALSPAEAAAPASPAEAAAPASPGGASIVPGAGDPCAASDACIDQYLWSLYERTPKIDTIKVSEKRKVKVKRKGRIRTVVETTSKLVDEDFAWKDLKAAEKAGMSPEAYVIDGMDPTFKRTLYHALRTMDAAGLEPGITSAFRDDYRQSIASGNKASVDRSYHGGSRRGGYGHGLAVDLVSVKGATRAERYRSSEELWNWIDAHGRGVGIGRPYLDFDPPHVAPIDGEEYAKHRGGATRTAATTPARTVESPKAARRTAKAGRAVVPPKAGKRTAKAERAVESPKAARRTAQAERAVVPRKAGKRIVQAERAVAPSKVARRTAQARRPVVSPKAAKRTAQAERAVTPSKAGRRTSKARHSGGSARMRGRQVHATRVAVAPKG